MLKRRVVNVEIHITAIRRLSRDERRRRVVTIVTMGASMVVDRGT